MWGVKECKAQIVAQQQPSSYAQCNRAVTKIGDVCPTCTKAVEDAALFTLLVSSRHEVVIAVAATCTGLTLLRAPAACTRGRGANGGDGGAVSNTVMRAAPAMEVYMLTEVGTKMLPPPLLLLLEAMVKAVAADADVDVVMDVEVEAVEAVEVEVEVEHEGDAQAGEEEALGSHGL